MSDLNKTLLSGLANYYHSLLNFLVRSLLIAKHQSRLTRKTSNTLGLCAGILRLLSKFGDVQSKINCTNSPLVGLHRICEVGCTAAAVFKSSGRILSRHSAVALQLPSTCSVDSTGAEQSLQAGLMWG